MKRKQNIILIILMTINFTINIGAQVNKNTYTVSSWWNSHPEKFSPVVNNDNTITFRYHAPTAKKVELHFGEWFVKPQQMEMDSGGIWEIKIGPLEPQIYAYNFKVDNTWIIDPKNTNVKVGTMVYSSMVEVCSNVPRFDEIQDVPHGSLAIHQYKSSSLNMMRNVCIALPADYYINLDKAYPVLYLRHGGGDDEKSWSSMSGRAQVIADNIVANKEGVPMIIVMTNGMTDGTWAGGSSVEGMTLLEQELINDVIPLVEKTYRVLPGQKNRAIAGLSMGGGQSVIIGLRNLDKFGWIGDFSSGLLSAVEFNINEYVPDILSNAKKVNKELQLLWIACGKDDPRYLGHINFAKMLERKGFKLTFHDVPGGHEWIVWRKELNAFLKEVFKQ